MTLVACPSSLPQLVMPVSIAFIKVRFVGLYFMELREAPMLLRGLFETYCIAVCTLVISVLVFA